MSGGGNDFVVLESGAASSIGDLPRWVRAICRRGFSVGADGVLILEPEASGSIRMVHYNADGGRSELCGNGTRCAARWAQRRGLVADSIRLTTDCGPMEAFFLEGGAVEVRLGIRCPAPEERAIDMRDGSTVSGYYVRIGIPHFIVRVDAVADVPVAIRGGEIRRHPGLGADGANVSFVAVRPGLPLEIRTYERGVEAETLACGTGCVAAAVVAVDRGWRQAPVACRPRSGIELTVAVRAGEQGYEDLGLTGDARVICEGAIGSEAAEWFEARPA